MATLINKDGTSAADNLTYDQGGTGVVYHTGAGSDKVNIIGGSITVVNDSGNDIFNVTGGSGHNITGGANNDTLNVNGASIVDATLGSGKDVVNLKNTSGRKPKGAMSIIRGGDWTDTFTVEEGATYYQLYGDAGNDIFEVKGGNNVILWGGAANDTYTVTGGTGIKLRGGDSADVYNISTDAVDMQLGYGNDVVNVTAGNEQTIKANLGINTINLMAGARHVITSDIDQVASQKAGKDVGYGVDKLFMNGSATYVTANLGDGKDEVNVSRGYGHKIYTEGWGDTINISGSASNSLFDAGDGDDIINISGGNNNTVVGGAGNDIIQVTGGNNNILAGGYGKDTYQLNLDNNSSIIIQEKEFKQGDTELLDLTCYEKSEFEYYQNDNRDALFVNAEKNIQITIQGWNQHVIDVIKFSDGELAGQGLMEKPVTLKINTDNGSYRTLAGDDTITVSGSHNTIDAGFGNNTVTMDIGSNNTTVNLRGDGSTIMINSNNNLISAGEGDDIAQISFEDGTKEEHNPTGNKVDLGDGDNILIINGGTANIITTGNGYDSIDIYGGRGHNISTGAGVDEILVYGGTELTLKAGAGDDLYSLIELADKGHYVIDQAEATKADYDILELSNYTRQEFQLTALVNGTMEITHNPTGATISIINADNAMLSEIIFSNTTLKF